MVPITNSDLPHSLHRLAATESNEHPTTPPLVSRSRSTAQKPFDSRIQRPQTAFEPALPPWVFARCNSNPRAASGARVPPTALNGQRAYFVISLFLVTYGFAIQKSRSFTALFP